jgi:predicted metal-dependent enzyme (double-stranded beta helix superfamily)
MTMTDLTDGIRTAICEHADWDTTAQLVADQLRKYLPDPDVLTAEQRLGSPDGYTSHQLHIEPDGSFSIIAVVWRPGQLTRIHDHLTWCVVGVIQGTEQEELFDADLNLIDRVHNTSDETAISIHVYGTDVSRTGSSVRRFYN